MGHKRKCIILFAVILIFCIAAAVLVGCNENPPEWTPSAIAVTVLNGEHYRVKGENKRNAVSGQVSFEIELDEGYEVIGAFGDECEVTNNFSWQQSITFTNVHYSSSVQLETKLREVVPFETFFEEDLGGVVIQSTLGRSVNGEGWYQGDVLFVKAESTEETRFLGWSTNGYLSAGGELVTVEEEIVYDTRAGIGPNQVYANFKRKADEANCIIYDLGDGEEIIQDCTAMIAHHPRANTLTEKNLLDDGYTLQDTAMLIGWQTTDGEYVGLGSRVSVSDKEAVFLNAIWQEYTDEKYFSISNGVITSFTGNVQKLVIPKSIDGKQVVGLGENAFANCGAEAVFIPSTVTSVKPNAFLNCTTLTDLYMSDNVKEISDASFTGCANLTTLHMNAVMKPYYSDNFYAPKTDVFDNLIETQGKKIILTAGSSVRYGYDCKIIEDKLPDYTPFNFGLNASINGFIWYEVISKYLGDGDIYLHAPELKDVSMYSILSKSPLTGENCHYLNYINYFIIFESNWQLASNLRIKNYCNLFDAFAVFNYYRDDSKTNNTYADYSEDKEHDGYGGVAYPERGQEGRYFGADGNISFDLISVVAVEGARDEIYNGLINKGVKVFVTFPPINRTNLLRTYITEEDLYSAAASYTTFIKQTLSVSAVTVLLSQYDTIYDSQYFYDTDYHLGTPTNKLHTEKIINALLAELNKG